MRVDFSTQPDPPDRYGTQPLLSMPNEQLVVAPPEHGFRWFLVIVVCARSARDDDCPEIAEKKRGNGSGGASIRPLNPRRSPQNNQKTNSFLGYFVGTGACCTAHTGASRRRLQGPVPCPPDPNEESRHRDCDLQRRNIVDWSCAPARISTPHAARRCSAASPSGEGEDVAGTNFGTHKKAPPFRVYYPRLLVPAKQSRKMKRTFL